MEIHARHVLTGEERIIPVATIDEMRQTVGGLIGFETATWEGEKMIAFRPAWMAMEMLRPRRRRRAHRSANVEA